MSGVDLEDDDEDAWSSEAIHGRDVATIPVTQIGGVYPTPDDADQPWTWVCPEWPRAERAVNAYLREYHVSDASAHTLRAYAYVLQKWLRFCWAIDLEFDGAVLADFRDFRRFLAHRGKTHGARRARGGGFQQHNAKTGKVHADNHAFSSSTLAQSRTVLRGWYEYLYRANGKPLVSPIPRSVRRERGDRSPHAHHNPLQEFRPTRSRLVDAPKGAPDRMPRHIPDAAWDDLWAVLTCDRDRALIQVQVDSLARASEVLGVLGFDVDWGTPTITITRKGSRVRDALPISPQAVIWLMRYQKESGYVPAFDQPLFVTLREPRERLTYNAYRAVLHRANAKLGTDWTSHDFRHTGAIRMLDAGVRLPYVQHLLGHTDPKTTSRYLRPRLEDIIKVQQDYWSRPTPLPGASQYDTADLSTLFGNDA